MSTKSSYLCCQNEKYRCIWVLNCAKSTLSKINLIGWGSVRLRHVEVKTRMSSHASTYISYLASSKTKFDLLCMVQVSAKYMTSGSNLI